jgi:cardiolipin synthase
MLHAKLFIVGEAVYVGSFNLDPRSLKLNYEMMVRLEGPQIAAAARKIFADCQTQCRSVMGPEWRRTQSFWTGLKQHFARVILGRLDPWITLTQWRTLID